MTLPATKKVVGRLSNGQEIQVDAFADFLDYLAEVPQEDLETFLTRTIAMLFTLLGFSFYAVNVLPFKNFDKLYDDSIPEEIRTNPNIRTGISLTAVTATIAAVVPLWKVFFILFKLERRGDRYLSKVVNGSLHVLFLVIAWTCNVLYMSILSSSADDLKLETWTFQFNAGWVSLSCWTISLGASIWHLVLVIIDTINTESTA